MEQQKVLIVIISAALFVAAVLGVGLALFYPDAEAATEAAFDPIEYAREPEPAEEESVIVYGDEGEAAESEETGEAEERVILLTEESAEAGDGEPPADAGDSTAADEITSRPARATAAEPEPSEPQERVVASREPSPTREPAAQRQPVRSTTSYEAAPEQEPRRMRVTEHWIQLISSPNKERVDAVRDRLREEYSLGARVTTREIESTTYYRLRVGPYDDRGEAEKFLAWIRDIDGFSEAYISEEYPLRTVR